MTQTFLCDIDPHSKAVNHICHDKLCKKSQLSFSFTVVMAANVFM